MFDLFQNLEGYAERQSRIQEYIGYLNDNNMHWDEDLSDKRQYLGLNSLTSEEIKLIENNTI